MSVWGLTAPLALIAVYLLRRQQQSQQTHSQASKCKHCGSHSDAASSAAATSAGAAVASSAASASTPAAKAAASRSRPTYKGDKLKMVLVVRNDLGMGKGKMMAQCCHAAVGVVRELEELEPEMLAHWEEHGAMKIALKANSEEELDALEALADEKGLANYLVVDAGHTQIAPDTKTVLAIGPAPASVLDKLTGHLKLM